MKQRNMDDSLHIISKTEKEEFKQAALHAYSSQGIQDNETPNIAAGDATEKNIKDGEELVNINTAVKQELMALPKIGPVTAERIIRFRDDFGPFQSIDDLAKIKGIGPKTLEWLKTRIII
ncbi:MAG: ComEA family DNA-binding protein [Candidatus Neomarinimicrobiota bacterium]|nr:ComEA family DNA-binding protein [Candidatus Neomarinimicrobiota bacterium]